METASSDQTQQFAPRWRRLAARVIDLAAVAAICIGGLWLLSRSRLDQGHLPDLFIFGTLLIYEALLPWATRGYTLGIWIARIRLVSEASFDRPSLLSAVGRLATRVGMFAVIAVFIAYDIELPGAILVLVIEGIVAVVTSKRQTIADIVGRTIVIRTLACECAA